MPQYYSRLLYPVAMPPAFLLFLLLLALGYLLQRSGRFSRDASDTLNRFVIDVCLPALVLRMVPKLVLRWDLLTLVITPWLGALIAWLVVRLLARVFAWDLPTRTALFLCASMGNTAFLGFPLCSTLLGEKMLPLAVVYDQFGSFLLVSTLGTIAVARASGGAAPTPAEVWKRVLTFPPFIALLVALVPFPRPVWLDGLLTQVSSALVPCAIFAVGLRMRITFPRERAAFFVGLLLKLLVLPLAGWGIARLTHAPDDVLKVNVVQSAMPSMITAGALAMMAGLAPELAAGLVGYGILLSLVTLQVWARVLG